MSLTNREKSAQTVKQSAPNREKIGTQKATIFSPLVFHRFRPHDFTSAHVEKMPLIVRLIRGLTVEPPSNDSGALQPGRPPESEPNRPEKAPESEWGLGASTENTP